MKIGELANVEPVLLQNAFSAYKMTHEIYEKVALTTHRVPVAIYCNTCKSESPVKNYVFRCDTCGAPSSEIVSGEELLIHKIHLREHG